MIGNHAFYNCIALLNVTIPANVNTIGQFAFSNCTALKYASFGMGPNDPIVGDFAFSNCTSLTSVILGSGVTGIGNYAFSGCPSLTTMNFEGNAPTLGANWLSGHDPKLVVYFHYGTTGYTTPAWSGISMISQYQLTLSTNLGNTTPAVGISWINAGSSQTITAIAPTGATYVFNGWIGTGTGSYTGKNNHASVIMNGEITEKANWTVQASIQYQLTVTANVGSTTGSGLCNHGSMASISATAPKATIGVRYTFNGWTGTGTGSYTGKNNPAMVTVNCAITEKANWTAQYLVTFKQYGLGNSAGTNTVLTVGSTMYDYKDLPAGIWVTGGTTFRWSSPVSGGAGKQFKLTGSSGLASPISAPGTDTGNYLTQYQLTMATNHGSVGPVSGSWYNAGSHVTITATSPSAIARERYVFIGWTGTGCGCYTGLFFHCSKTITITMNGPIKETAWWAPMPMA